RTLPPLTLYPPCPYYQLAGEGQGETRVDARVNLDPSKAAGLKMRLELVDSAGASLLTRQAEFSGQNAAGVDFKVPVQTPAVFLAKAQLIDSSGQSLGDSQYEIHVIPSGQSKVTTGADGFLRVNGQPNFPIGMYSCGHFEEMAAAGFSATHSYAITIGEASDPINSQDGQLAELLDKSWANGMKMMVELPRKAIEKADWFQVRRRILTFRYHPGLLCWGSEERVARGAAPLKNMAALYSLVHELDLDHPLVLGDTRDVIQHLQTDRRNFFPDDCMDAGIWWWYPFPDKEIGSNGAPATLEPPSWLVTTLSKKPLWIAVQSYQKPNRDARFPTPEEYRYQAYLSIIDGVKGLFFYTGSGQRDFDGKPAGLLNKPKAAHWDYVQKLVTELRQQSSMFMAPVGHEKIEFSPSSAPVEFTLRDFNGSFYLIAANKSFRAQSVTFKGNALEGKSAEVLGEGSRLGVRVQGSTLTDEFPPLGVHIYQFK
ncbi:MAG TPA: hypothetical protein VFC44_10810, partial [Candidatus Saccharimonadales bacterium]|nr:hypothetical protein [Candidatus Saccharimonadales bacterium]